MLPDSNVYYKADFAVMIDAAFKLYQFEHANLAQ